MISLTAHSTQFRLYCSFIIIINDKISTSDELSASFRVCIFTARSELRNVLFLALLLFCLCMKCLWNRLTNLRQIHTEDVFGPSLGRVLMSRSKVKDHGHRGQKKRHFSGPFGGLRAVYVW